MPTLEGDHDRLVVHAPLERDTVTDVCFDGWRTWSVTLTAGERHELRWPRELAGRLAGRARVSVRTSVGGHVLAEGELDFGGEAGAPRLTDATGRRLSINKWDKLGPAFDGQDPAVRERMLDELERLVEVCRRELGIEVFVSYGTLLGAVRAGRILDHDDDADLGYLSTADNPADLALEGFAHERALVAAGYDVVRHSTGHLQVVFHREDGSDDFHIDLFTCFVLGGTFFQAFAVGAPASDVHILPLTTVTLNGRALPAPADPQSLLAASYGPSWRVPDPGFRFTTARAARHRLSNWLGGGLHGGREAWQAHHLARHLAHHAEHPAPSPFAVWVRDRLPAGRPVVDIGCGAGADLAFLAADGRAVRGLDFAPAALDRVRSLTDAPLDLVNLHDRHAVLRHIATLARWRPDADLYCRQVLDAVEPRGVENVLLMARALLRPGGSAWVEVRRTAPDDGLPYREPDLEQLRRDAARHALALHDVPTTNDEQPTLRLRITTRHEAQPETRTGP